MSSDESDEFQSADEGTDEHDNSGSDISLNQGIITNNEIIEEKLHKIVEEEKRKTPELGTIEKTIEIKAPIAANISLNVSELSLETQDASSSQTLPFDIKKFKVEDIIPIIVPVPEIPVPKLSATKEKPDCNSDKDNFNKQCISTFTNEHETLKDIITSDTGRNFITDTEERPLESCDGADVTTELTNIQSSEVTEPRQEINPINVSEEDKKDKETTTSSLPSEKPPKIKASKIGLKKPREKLGEKLGSKKLGSRVTKPLVGISSDSLKTPNQNIQNVLPIQMQPNSVSELENPGKTYSDDNWNSNEATATDTSGWGSWGDWGSTLASAASTLTKEVSKGVGTVLETVESGMGIPDPETMAQETVEIEKKLKEMNLSDFELEEQKETLPKQEIKQDKPECNEQSFGFGFGGFSSLVSEVSGAIETASTKVLLGGLDTLEKIGRKTMDVIQDGDPGLRRKRKFLKSRSSNLSSVLQEARQRAIEEEEYKSYETVGEGSPQGFRQISITQIWESTEGSAHTEALTLIANRCQSKTSSLMQDLPALGINRLIPFINKIKACSEISEENNISNVTEEISKITRDIELPLQFVKILRGWPSLEESLRRLSIQIQGFGGDECQLNDIQRDLFQEVAQFVASAVGLIHKAAELALVTHDLDCVTMAQQFQRLCGCLSSGLEQSADDVCESITRSLPSSESFVTSSVTNIYVQMAEANSFLQNSLQYLTVALIQAQVKQIASELL